MTYESGNTFEGDWVNDYPLKGALFESSTNNQMSGTWNRDLQLTGEYCSLKHPSGLMLEGLFNNGAFISGRGTVIYGDNTRYEGDLRGDETGKKKVREGQGKYWFSKGKYMEGTWVNDQIVRGIFVSEDEGKHYEGGFKDRKFNGEGTLTKTVRNKKVVHKGMFKDGDKQGKGTTYYYVGDKLTKKEEGYFDGKEVSSTEIKENSSA